MVLEYAYPKFEVKIEIFPANEQKFKLSYVNISATVENLHTWARMSYFSPSVCNLLIFTLSAPESLNFCRRLWGKWR